MQRGALAGAAVALLLVTAGCIQVGPTDGDRFARDQDVAPEPVEVEEVPSRSLPAPPTEPAVIRDPGERSDLYDIPWENVTVVVGVNNTANPDRNVTTHVAEAIAYWEGAGARYSPYSVDFVLRPDAEDPDVEVRFVERVDCSTGRAYIGCAPKLTPGTDADGTQVVQVKSGYNDAATGRIVEHEFGHLLGLSHGDDPMPLMASEFGAVERSVPNATERSFPWHERNLTVYVNDGDLAPAERAATIRQVAKAIDYYEYDTDRLPENGSLKLTDDRRTADIVVSFPEELDCNVQEGSCSETAGYDPDTDPALEYYTRTHIAVSGVETDAIGWHVGYWLGHSLGADTTADLPEPFQNASYEDRRDWWVEG